ncbi:Electron transfer flavoprotein-ubiquinone oxidoreductase [Plasmodiophora brassicae]
MEFDVVVVGAGPAGLSTAIRLKQRNPDVNVCVVEKAAEVGDHILSGNVFDPKALNELFPDWRDRGAPLDTPVATDRFKYLVNEKTAIPCPIPPSLHNEGCYIISLGSLVRWLGDQAVELGVEIFPGFAASEVLYKDDQVIGIATADLGIGKNGQKKDTYQEGVELHASQTVFAEGARGSLTELIIGKYNLRNKCDPPSYSIGFKELWQVKPEVHRPGLVTHTMGWPLPNSVYGGSYLYHLNPDLVAVGLVVGLDYANPYLNPYEEFQRFKHHASISPVLEGATPVAYGARAISTGGFQSIPRLSVPGGLLVGCAAGFMNVPRIKGTHTAMKSGILAADAIIEQSAKDNSLAGADISSYETALRNSWIASELKTVRNVKPSFKFGTVAGILYSGLETIILRGHEPWTFHNSKQDAECTGAADKFTPPAPFRPDGRISFDLLSNLARSGVNHQEDQPCHLRLRAGVSDDFPVKTSLGVYAGPEQRFCPAKVYEFVDDGAGGQRLQINAQNCVHCKTCDIKTPSRYIQWTSPEGGGGPAYPNM